MASKIKTLAVFGGGLMGSGIAQVAAQTGHKVTIVDVSEEILSAAKKRIQDSLTKSAQKTHANDANAQQAFVTNTMKLVSTSTDRKKAVSGECDLVIEAVREDLKTKHELWAEVDKNAPKHTLFATNTSSLRLADMATAITRRSQFGGMHFFNPVPLMKLVEVVKAAETSDETHQRMMDFGKEVGKTPVSCKDTPGFIVNRLLVPYLLEAVRMVERGEAKPQDIDTAMKLGAGYPMGPFTLSDVVGLDTLELILQQWHEREKGNPLFDTIPLLTKLVKEGKFGMKSGAGFYTYRRRKAA